MASSKKDFEDLTPIECPICTELFSDPTALPCGHCYCGPPKNCLNGIQKDNCLRCAVCNGEFNMQLSQLKPLYGIRDYLKQATSKGKNHEEEECFDVMCRKHTVNTVLFWCNSCSKKACQKCFELDHESHALIAFRKHLKQKIEPLYAKMKDRLALIQNGAVELTEMFAKVEAHQDQRYSFGRCLNDLHNFTTESKIVETFLADYDQRCNLNSIESFVAQSSEDLNQIENKLRMIKVSNFPNFKVQSEFAFEIPKFELPPFLQTPVGELLTNTLMNNGWCEDMKYEEIGMMRVPHKRIINVEFRFLYNTIDNSFHLKTTVSKNIGKKYIPGEIPYLGRVEIFFPALQFSKSSMIEETCRERQDTSHEVIAKLPSIEKYTNLLLKLQCQIFFGKDFSE